MPNPNNNKKFNDEALRINRSLKKENDKLKELIIPMQDLGRSLKKENDELKYQVELLNEIIEVLDESNKELRGQNEKQ